MKNKKQSAVLGLLAAGAIITGGIATNTWSKYVGKTTGNGKATIAKWAFEEDNAEQEFEIKLADTVDADTLVADRIAPGTKGSFVITLSNANTEVGVNYEISLGETANAPKHLQFCADETCSEVLDAENPITGKMAAEQESEEAEIFWQWVYEPSEGDTSNDEDDTEDGVNGGDMTVTLNITGTQINPTN